MITVCAVLALLVACGGSSSKATSTTAAPTNTAASGAAGATTAATTADTTSATATTADATATSDTSSTASTGDTGSSTGTSTDSTDNPVDNVTAIDPNALPNFTLTFSFDGQNMGTDGSTQISMDVEQSAVDNYHVKLNASGQTIESWLVDGNTYIDYGTGPTEAPADAGSSLGISPTDFLQQVPTISDIPGLQKVGEETVNGRKTTHYHLDGKDAGAFFASSGTSDMENITNGAGGLDVWIDNDLKIQMKATSDLTWTNADGTDGSLKYNFEISKIGSTDKVAAPAVQ